MTENILLICTVGGSHQPILTSIEQHRPVRVYFLCSADSEKAKGSYHQVEGPGKVLKSRSNLDKPDLPNILTLAALGPDQFHIHRITAFDDLNACYLEALQLIEKARSEFPQERIVVDYTGGTKSMTAGLTAAALDDGRCEISLVSGLRPDLIRVRDQTQFVRPVQVWDTQAMRRLRAARELLARYDYAAAEHLLRAAAARFASERTLQALQRGIALCRAFDAWDKFDHATARQLLEAVQGQFVPYWLFLNKVTRDAQASGFELVEDLMRNAERRAFQDRFDDAVGRIYRALELTAQVWLQLKHNIDTSDVRVADIPETMRATVAQCRDAADKSAGKIKIGLLYAWDVVAAFPGDPLGEHFSRYRNKIVNFLSKRNQSLFAHGTRPVSQKDYSDHAPGLQVFLDSCIADAIQNLGLKQTVVLAQLPTDFLDAEI